MGRERDPITGKYIKKDVFLEVQETVVETLKEAQAIPTMDQQHNHHTVIFSPIKLFLTIQLSQP